MQNKISVYQIKNIGFSVSRYYGISVYRVNIGYIGLSVYRVFGVSVYRVLGLPVYWFMRFLVYRFIGLSGIGLSAYIGLLVYRFISHLFIGLKKPWKDTGIVKLADLRQVIRELAS